MACLLVPVGRIRGPCVQVEDPSRRGRQPIGVTAQHLLIMADDTNGTVTNVTADRTQLALPHGRQVR